MGLNGSYMDGELFLLILFEFCLISFIVYAFWYSHKHKDDPNTIKFLSRLYHQAGLPIPRNNQVIIRGYLNKIDVCYTKNKKEKKFSIPVSKIKQISTLYDWQIHKQNVVNRAIVGAVVAGAVGGVVGAMTAKEKNKEILFVNINYIDENNEKSEILLSGNENKDMFVKDFINKCKKYYNSTKYNIV